MCSSSGLLTACGSSQELFNAVGMAAAGCHAHCIKKRTSRRRRRGVKHLKSYANVLEQVVNKEHLLVSCRHLCYALS